MTHANVVSITEMAGKLHDMDWLRERLSVTEPLDSVVFGAGSAKVRIDETDKEGKRWNDRELTDVAPAWLQVTGGERYALTRQAILEIGSECHIPRQYQQEVPTDLLAANVNWWLSSGLGERSFKLLTAGTATAPIPEGLIDAEELPLARAMTRASVSPFSNLALLDIILKGLEKKYGEGSILADYKFHHDLESTAFRLIVPGHQRVISGTHIADDTWSAGLQFKNSLTGLKQTALDAYLFRWWCTNGAIDTLPGSGGFARRGTTQEDVLLWARDAVDEILGGLEHTLDEVQEMVAIPVTGDVTAVLADLFTRHSLPVKQQKSIIAAMADTDDMTMYGLMQAATQAANGEGMDPRSVESLMRMGGHIVRSSAAGRCEGCRRLLPEGWEETTHNHDHGAVLSEVIG